MPVKVLLQEVRKSRDLSQNELARLTKMSPQNIQKIEQGEAKSLTFKTLTKFCQVLECQPGDLLVYEENLEVSKQINLNESQEQLNKKRKSDKLKDKHDCSTTKTNSFLPSMASIVIQPS